MSRGRLCPTCRERVAAVDASRCESCGRGFHDSCSTYFQSFDCRQCGEESWIGVLEF